ncbi:SDR family oxidoreductase [Thiolapillus sp.]
MGNENSLIAGCGYVGRRLAAALAENAPWGLVNRSSSLRDLEQLGIRGLRCDLKRKMDIRLPTKAAAVWYLVPPPRVGTEDVHLRHFLHALPESGQPRRIVLISTTGVYGDCRGQWVDESHAVAPVAERAQRRLDGEEQLRRWGEQTGGEWVILRVAGIYGPGKLPLKRLREGQPMVAEKDAPWTNRIHVDDLVQVCLAAMARGANHAIYNVADGQPGNMADYFNRVADMAGLPRPPVIDPGAAGENLSAGMRSYLAESRRIDNGRMLRELGVTLRYPDLDSGLRACFPEH